MSVQIAKQSRLVFAELLADDAGVEFFDLLVIPPLEEQADDLQHEVQAAERLDHLASRYYGDEALQWVIAHANDIELWPTGVHAGAVLRIPSPRYVLQVWLPRARPRTR